MEQFFAVLLRGSDIFKVGGRNPNSLIVRGPGAPRSESAKKREAEIVFFYCAHCVCMGRGGGDACCELRRDPPPRRQTIHSSSLLSRKGEEEADRQFPC